MKIKKSSRHAKITGDFSEHLILYWLSKYGFECARVDHTGIDLIARNPKNKERMGISVKSRSRTEGSETTPVKIERDNLRKAEIASRVFGCTPYLALVVDAGTMIRCFVLPLKALYRLYPSAKKRTVSWQMTEKAINTYYQRPDIRIFEFMSDTKRW